MDDRAAQFFLIVAQMSSAARVAGLEVEVTFADGTRRRGTPEEPGTAEGEDELDDIGFAQTFRVDGREVKLDTIAALTVLAPPAD